MAPHGKELSEDLIIRIVASAGRYGLRKNPRFFHKKKIRFSDLHKINLQMKNKLFKNKGTICKFSPLEVAFSKQ